MHKIRAFTDVSAEVTEREPRRHVESIGENRGFVGTAVAIGVFENDELVVGNLAGLELGVSQGAQDPEPAAGIPLHRDGIGDAECFVGEQAHLKVLVNLE